MKADPKARSPYRWALLIGFGFSIWFIPWMYVTFHDFEFETDRYVIEPLAISVEVSADARPFYSDSGTYWNVAGRQKGSDNVKAYPKPDGVDSFQSVVDQVVGSHPWFSIKDKQETVCGYEAARYNMYPAQPIPMQYIMVIDAETHIVELKSEYFRKPADRMFDSIQCEPKNEQ